jgi:hypothetical protein
MHQSAQGAFLSPSLRRSMFLMHRVELKDMTNNFPSAEYTAVPNAPCGVERRAMAKLTPQAQFLMHRVELKDKLPVESSFG